MTDALFYRGVRPSEIDRMEYFEMKRWYRVHVAIEAENRKRADEIMKSIGMGKK